MQEGKVMKKTFVYSLLAILALTGCQTKELETFIPETNEETIIQKEETKVFIATIEDDFGTETRTSLDGEGNVLWKMGNQVSIFAGSTLNEQYQVSDASDGKTAATLNKIPSGSFVAGTEIDNNVAFYPYASTAEIAKSGSSYVISGIELPATQTYAAGSFGDGAFPMAAVTSSAEDMNLKFKNVLGGLKLQLKGTAKIVSITISGNNDEKLYGDATVTMSYGGTPSISLSDASARTVTLDCGAGVALNAETATPFIIALPPMTMEEGFTVVVTDTWGKEMEISTSKSQTIPRSNLLRMPAVDYVVLPDGPVDMGMEVQWASCNLGASNPMEYGDYYAWGETAPYYTDGHSQDSYCFSWRDGKTGGYTWDSYSWCGVYNSDPEGDTVTLTKYNSDVSYGAVDDKYVLEAEDDAAQVKLGGNWRIPRYEEWEYLYSCSTWRWITLNGINGYLVTSTINGNSIFLPAAGWRCSISLVDVGSIGLYWSSDLNTMMPDAALGVYLVSSSVDVCSGSTRYYGNPIRPVYEP